jgi:hypothetical protein
MESRLPEIPSGRGVARQRRGVFRNVRFNLRHSGISSSLWARRPRRAQRKMWLTQNRQDREGPVN